MASYVNWIDSHEKPIHGGSLAAMFTDTGMRWTSISSMTSREWRCAGCEQIHMVLFAPGVRLITRPPGCAREWMVGELARGVPTQPADSFSRTLASKAAQLSPTDGSGADRMDNGGVWQEYSPLPYQRE